MTTSAPLIKPHIIHYNENNIWIVLTKNNLVENQPENKMNNNFLPISKSIKNWVKIIQWLFKILFLRSNRKGIISKSPRLNEIMDSQINGNSYNSVNIHEVLAINHKPKNMFSNSFNLLGAE